MNMKVAQLPKSWLIHSVDYLQQGSKDRWGEVKHEETTVNYVRVEPTKSYAVNERQEGITYSLVVFVDGVHSSHTSFTEGNKIRFEGNEYVIGRVLVFHQPNENTVHHIELELM